MLSNHTNLSVPASELAKRGKFTHLSGNTYRHESPGSIATGVGPIGSYWSAEAGEVIPVGSIEESSLVDSK